VLTAVEPVATTARAGPSQWQTRPEHPIRRVGRGCGNHRLPRRARPHTRYALCRSATLTWQAHSYTEAGRSLPPPTCQGHLQTCPNPYCRERREYPELHLSYGSDRRAFADHLHHCPDDRR
jgi:hypothetical protein